MNKEFAIETKQHALHCVEHLTSILYAEQFAECSPEVQERLKRNIGILIGEIQMTVLEEVYQSFPELDDLK
ncbi:hypothetical protein E6P74_05210 [Moraxella lacunata]|nr:hypothetical protein [Moraxella lacunata]MDI4482724.1 hypothetical protein [Moraxella lacunata]MDI4507179.1 hypothetical protein [Moraxella lacunata]OBX61867.1 hypothetical protein A9309_07525 [Moraxella lacunata]OBX64634.1 hypothetical protein A9Z63_03015 [Moraxella lacunata]OPH35910.1 hypothetical protein B5J94_08120 [Moraxella lacunata]